ncbi:hypothetical protein [Devosia salina]|uniref:Uncharacterized protein n=1 Tax=Devosia salina TaxID=2860336 RepID=A0ABX8WMW7_9HYPH|nr:hypothetical protein [Devosia salina]QYO78351.1 hypothetical protein K1X15_07335 [Devosia salina]
MNVSIRIKAAREATTAIRVDWFSAVEALRTGGDTNGYGALSDPSDAICRLLEARSSLEKAIAAFRSVDWPTDDDYDEQQQNESEEARRRLAETGFEI